MYALQDYIGEDRVTRALSSFVKDYAFKGAPYPTTLDLIAYLQKETPPEFQYLYHDWFETITIFDNRAISVSYSQTAGGKYAVDIVVEAKKYESDGKGQEHLIPVHDLVDIGVMDRNGKPLYLQKHEITQERQEFKVTVDKPPTSAGIDPLIKLIDRNPDDNVVSAQQQ
jgi:hypothetical protein